MEELRPGLWTWTAPHPEWKPGQGWDEVVRCYAAGTVLIDPLDPPVEGTAVVLTVRWHVRSSRGLGVPVHAPAADAKRIKGSLPYEPGDELPGGIEAVAGFSPNEPFLWLPEHRALVSGDILHGDGNGGLSICPQSWMPKGTTTADAVAGLQHLLDLPVEIVLPTHGDPTDGDALRAVL